MNLSFFLNLMNKMTIDNTEANHQKFVFWGPNLALGDKNKGSAKCYKNEDFLGEEKYLGRHYF
jgi:hypothetical protein